MLALIEQVKPSIEIVAYQLDYEKNQSEISNNFSSIRIFWRINGCAHNIDNAHFRFGNDSYKFLKDPFEKYSSWKCYLNGNEYDYDNTEWRTTIF